MAENEFRLDIRLIEAGDRLSGLSLGDETFTPLKIFLQKHAKAFQANSLARTYGAFDASKARIIGYITLVCGQIVTGDGNHKLVDDPAYRYDHYPAIKIARLAVDQNMRKNRLGRTLVDLALGIAKDTISPAVGCRFVVVDSKQNAVQFYQRCGFTLLDTDANRARSEPVMFIDLHKA